MPRDATSVDRANVVHSAQGQPAADAVRTPFHQAPDTTRIGGLIPRAPTTRSIALTAGAIRDGNKAAEVISDQLSYAAFDWVVTRREVVKSIDALRGLDDAALSAAVEATDPKLLSRLEAKMDAGTREAYGDTIVALRAARNAPSANPEPADDVIRDLRRSLDGILRADLVTDNGARTAIDRLRRQPPDERERILGALGPSKAYRMVDNLSELDQVIFHPMVELVKSSYFGRMLRDAEAAGLGPKDVTPSFETLLGEVSTGAAVRPADIADYVYFVVPGLVTEHQPGYFDANVAHLQSLGLDVHRSKIDTDADVDVNAAQIREEIKALAAQTGRKVMLITHSKGGPDAAEALQDPETEACVHRFIPMQPAIATPVASTLMESGLASGIRDAFTGLLGASTGEALAHLAFGAARERFLRSRPLTVPTLTLASTVGDHFSALRGVSDLIEARYGVLSDGLVTIDEQFVPGRNSFRAVLDGVDHTAPCSRPLPGSPPLEYSQRVLTEALVIQALRL